MKYEKPRYMQPCLGLFCTQAPEKMHTYPPRNMSPFFACHSPNAYVADE